MFLNFEMKDFLKIDIGINFGRDFGNVIKIVILMKFLIFMESLQKYLH
jgi:hypothetical protein